MTTLADIRRAEKGKTCKACLYWTTDRKVCIWCGKKP